jgi:Cu-Zn family superoxide dismutase
MRAFALAPLVVSLVFVAARGSAQEAAEPPVPDRVAVGARLAMHDLEGRDLGRIAVRDTPAGLLIDVRLDRVPSGTHGFHVHSVGRCEPPFESAGAHLATAKHAHGFLDEQGPHAGDLVNLEVPSGGRVRQTLRAPDLTMADLRDADGAAFVLHARPDDYETQPSGGSGDRIACARIDPRVAAPTP